MFLRYAYLKENGKTILCLYKTTRYEFAKEVEPKKVKKRKVPTTLEEDAISYIKEKKLPTAFDKIYILVDGNLVKTISKEQFELEERTLYQKKQDEATFPVLIRDKSSVQEINLLKYLVGALFTNCPFPMHKETLKAITILYRTYALESLEQKGMIEASNPYVIYKDPLLYKFTYLETFYDMYNLLREVVLETQGLYLMSNGKPIKPYIHLVSSGYTKTNGIDTYLVSKQSLWDLKAKNYLQPIFISYEELTQKLSLEKTGVKPIFASKPGEITFGKKHFSLETLALRLHIPSTTFTCIEEKNGVTFLCRGIGNNMGLSIYGANYLAEQGLNYSQILAYYFQNILLYHL